MHAFYLSRSVEHAILKIEIVLDFVESAFGRVANKTVGTMFETSIRPNTYLIRIKVIKIFRFAIV